MKQLPPYGQNGRNWEDETLTEAELERRHTLMFEQKGKITLNGVPAQILGAKLWFAVVVTIEPDPVHHIHIEVEYSWKTIDYIIQNKEGKFTS